MGADADTGNEVSENRAEAEAFGDRDGNDCSRQVNEGGLEEAGITHGEGGRSMPEARLDKRVQ